MLWAGVCAAAPLEVLIDQSTGATYLQNFDALPLNFAGYSIESMTPTFSFPAWTPVAGNYDASGNGSVDAFGNWTVLSEPGSNVDLSEGVLSGPGGTLAPGQRVALGALWTGGDMNVTASYVVGFSSFPADVVFRLNPADYNRDLAVDIADYGVFFATFGQTIDLRADGNGDGVVDAADYTVWRDLFLNPPVAVLPTLGVSVPEPSMELLAALALAAVLGLNIGARPRVLLRNHSETTPAIIDHHGATESTETERGYLVRECRELGE